MRRFGKMTLTVSGECALVMTRAFAAPRTLVFRTLIEPELVRQWLLGPPGWTMPVCEIDARVGGRYRYEWEKAGGHRMGMGGVFLEIDAPQRVSQTEEFDQSWYPGHAVDTTVLAEEDGVTLMTLTVTYESAEALAVALKSGMEHGMEAGYERLEKLLVTLA